MTEHGADSEKTAASIKQHIITVLLVDDQAIIGEAVRRMLDGEKDIAFHYCSDPTQALKKAAEIEPTVILQDLVMPEIDGLTLVKFFRANAKTKDVPLIVLSTKEEPKIKAEAFAFGANDYLVKLPDRIELIARIRHHSKGYISLLERNEAYQALEASQKKLADELAQAAVYVRSLLPATLSDGIKTDWRFIPSESLGGDSFGYHWLDDTHFAIYLLDVCGHGIGSALLSISAMNVLRSNSLPNVDMRKPNEVLGALNENFQMEKQNNLYFTIWYGVFNKDTREIVYSSGGHPPAILLTGPAADSANVLKLKTNGFIIGGMPGLTFESERRTVEEFGKLFLYSDGAYEIFGSDGKMLDFEYFVEQLAKPSDADSFEIERIVKFVREYQNSESFEDDFSLMEIRFS